MDPSLAELDTVARLAQPYLVAALRSLGAKVLDHAEDAAAEGATDAADRAGRRLWRLVARRRGARAELDAAVRDVQRNPDFPDYETVLRMKLVGLLKQDPELLRELRAALDEVEPQATYRMTVSRGSAGAQGPGAQAYVINQAAPSTADRPPHDVRD
ncbi:hypothetical protein KDL01_07325 [Actinospica durhamensis]|uniref:Uncharacterized protein n=1 Tax=Actinospica durhamensis TaxID=1508375 RepID=A0A941IQL8_9ACTN|nr:hypothetical protein [Actinospica durhamensis]MBR7833068.1 hypothetical protein [Actinospica durhamensis]